MRDPAISRDSFRRSLKTFLLSAYLCTIAHYSYLDDALYKFTYLLTYRSVNRPSTDPSYSFYTCNLSISANHSCVQYLQ